MATDARHNPIAVGDAVIYDIYKRRASRREGIVINVMDDYCIRLQTDKGRFISRTGSQMYVVPKLFYRGEE